MVWQRGRGVNRRSSAVLRSLLPFLAFLFIPVVVQAQIEEEIPLAQFRSGVQIVKIAKLTNFDQLVPNVAILAVGNQVFTPKFYGFFVLGDRAYEPALHHLNSQLPARSPPTPQTP
jgi:hypothetical protein